MQGPHQVENWEKVGNFVIGREVGKMSGKTKHLKKCCCVGKKVLFLYRGLGLDLFASWLDLGYAFNPTLHREH